MAIQDFSIDTSGSPQEVQRKQALAEALMKQGTDSSPAAGGKNGGWITALNRGLAGALGGYQRGAASEMEQQGRSQAQQLAAGLLGEDGKVNQQAYIQASSNPWVRPEQLGAVGKVADWQYTAERDKVGDQHWGASFGLQKNADARATAAESRAAADYENTPDQYVPNPRAGEPGQPKFIDQYAQAKAIAEAENTKPTYGLNPIYGTGPDGKPAVVQLSNTGKAAAVQMPEGVQFSKEPMRVDAGTHINLIDPITRQIVGSIPKNVAAVEQQKVLGEEAGKGQVALPNVIANSEQIIRTLDGIDKHPGKSISLGVGSMAPTIPGTKQADFRANMDQLNGQTFLQAYQTLKGGGAITDIEGAKGSNALARMQTAQSEASFNEALQEFKSVIRAGVERAKAKAGSVAPVATEAQPIVIDGYTIKAR